MAALLLAHNEHMLKAIQAQSQLGRNIENTGRHMGVLERGAGRFLSHIREATISMLRWGRVTTELAGLFTGLAGAGGLWGIHRLANQASDVRKESGMLGVTPAEAMAFPQSYNRFLTDPRATLQAVSSGMLDVTSPQYTALLSLGFTPQQLSSMSPTQVAQALVEKTQQFVRRPQFRGNQQLIGAAAQAYGLPSLGITPGTLRLMGSRDPREVEQAREQMRRQLMGTALSDKILKSWDNLRLVLEQSGTKIWTTFVVGLEPLTPKISKLSQAFADLVAVILKSDAFKYGVDLVAKGIEKLAEWFRQLKKEDIDAFSNHIKQFMIHVGEFVGKFAGLVEHSNAFFSAVGVLGKAASAIIDNPVLTGAVAGALVGARMGPMGAAIGAAVGAGIGLWAKEDPTKPYEPEDLYGGRVPGAPLRDMFKADPTKPFGPGFGADPYGQGQMNNLLRRHGLGEHSSARENLLYNNPGNIKTISGAWANYPSTEAGVDAIGEWLDRAQRVHGLMTLRQLIDDPKHGYAPSNDPGNRGKGLPEAAARIVGVGPDDPINVGDAAIRQKLLQAILTQEYGAGYADKLLGRIGQGAQADPSENPSLRSMVSQIIKNNNRTDKPESRTSLNNMTPASANVRIVVENRTGGSAVISNSMLGATA